MHILSIDKEIQHSTLNIDSIALSMITEELDISPYDYIIISGGDGTIRRVLKALHSHQNLPPFILNATGSFNVIAKLHRVSKVEKVLNKLAQDEIPNTQPQQIYSLNQEVFLFSAGNMGDLQHIFLSETLRFGLLEKGIAKYFLSALFLLPVHLMMTPFMLMSKQRFFIFTPLDFIKKFGSFYGQVEEMTIDLKNEYNFIELDGDVVNIKDSKLTIGKVNTIKIITKIRT
jgi:hypothetical protein